MKNFFYSIRHFFVWSYFFGFIVTVTVSAQNENLLPFRFSNKITAGNASTIDEFGWNVAIDGSTAVITDIGEEVGNDRASGAVYVFARISGLWNLQQTLVAPVGTYGSDFGYSIDIKGNTIAVGSRDSVNGLSKVYIYARGETSWNLQTELSGSPNESFAGPVVALSNNTLVVGSGGNGLIPYTGVAFVFVKIDDSWQYQAKLAASDGADSDKFGLSVSISGDTILIGASGDDIAFPYDNQGSAYIFTRNGSVWSQTAKLTIPNSTGFGTSCVLEGNTALIGTPSFLQGKAYVFVYDGSNWSLQAQLQANDTISANLFGFKVSLSGDKAIVGALKSSFGIDTFEGAAYVFSRNGASWSQTAKLYAPDRSQNDNFGRGVAISGNTAIVGANKDNFFSNTTPGAVYIFSDVSNDEPDLQVVSDHGTSQSDNITNSRQLAIDVNNVTIGSRVELLKNNVVIDSQIATGTTITFNDTVTSDGQFQYNSREIKNGLPSLPSSALLITVDTIKPTVTIDQLIGVTDPTTLGSIGFIINLSDSRNFFDPNFVSFTESTANLSQATKQVNGEDKAFAIMINNIISNGQFVRATIPGGTYTDVAGNFNLPSTSTDNTVTIDNVRPTVTINQNTGQPDPTRDMPLIFDVVFSEPVNSFGVNDIAISGMLFNTTNSTINVSGDGAVYKVTIGGIVSDGGYIQASIPQFAASDAFGNDNLPSTSTDNRITIDNVKPSVTINQAPGQSDPASTQPINFRVVFSEPISGFDSSDVSLASSTANISTAIVVVTGSGTIYNVAVSNITLSGSVKASIPANAVQDSLGNLSNASTSSDNTITFNLRNHFDFDGDGKSDLSVFRPSNGIWYLLKSNVGLDGIQFGQSGDLIAPADYDGDGKTDVAVYRSGTWYIQRSNLGFTTLQFGEATDAPVPGNYDADGHADVAVFRPSNGTWYLNRSSQGFTAIQFGQSGDKAIAADFDGDGRSDLAVFRPSSGVWYIQRSSAGFYAVQFGAAEDKPIAADYDGDGKTDVAVFRPSSGVWYLLQSTSGFGNVQFGQAGDLPAAADYDGDGKVDVAVYRNGVWYLNRSAQGLTAIQFGISEDLPAPNAFIR